MHRTLTRSARCRIDSRGHHVSFVAADLDANLDRGHTPNRPGMRCARTAIIRVGLDCETMLLASGAPPVKGRHALDGLWLLLVLLVTLAGVWLSSSLAAYLNGPMWLAGVLGLLAFPILPLGWEARAAVRRAKKDDSGLLSSPSGTASCCARSPSTCSSSASCSRAGRRRRSPPWPRGVTGSSRAGRAGRRRACAWRSSAPRAGSSGCTERPTGTPTTTTSRGRRRPRGEPRARPGADRGGGHAPARRLFERRHRSARRLGFGAGRSGTPPAEDAPKRRTHRTQPRRWPAGAPRRRHARLALPATLHPAVAALPADAESSIASVARHIAQRESDPWMRVKALHDYVADRVSYDVESYRAGRTRPRMRRRSSVRGGPSAPGTRTSWPRWARPRATRSSSSGRRAHERARPDGGRPRLERGARRRALDAPRCDLGRGILEGDRFVKRYSTEFLFTPPRCRGCPISRRRSERQLRRPPLSRGEFLRQPLMRRCSMPRDSRSCRPTGRRSRWTRSFRPATQPAPPLRVGPPRAA